MFLTWFIRVFIDFVLCLSDATARQRIKIQNNTTATKRLRLVVAFVLNYRQLKFAAISI